MPGAGKTTLSHRAAGLLRANNVMVLEPTYSINNEVRTTQRYLIKSWYSTKLFLLRTAWALNWILLVVQSRQKTLEDFLLMTINGLYVLEIYRHHRRHNCICLLDQGICQAILSLSYNSKKKEFLESRLAAALQCFSTLRFRIVHIETDTDTVVQRLAKRHRKRSRLERMKNATNFVRILHGEKRKIELLMQVLGTQLKADIHTVQANSYGNIHTAAKQIAGLFPSS